ncbi:MAG: MbnP family copper-binding protein [Sandaracinaceae bacterium]
MRARSFSLALALALSGGCAQGVPVTIELAARVGSEPAECGGMYAGIGTTSSTLELDDLRLYVHDVRLVGSDGSEVPLELDQDGAFQLDSIVLLDFEDGTAGCQSGNPQLNSTIRGTVSEGEGPFTGVRFKLGVPFERNHGNAAAAPSPLNVTSLFWTWNLGYKFVRIDSRTTGQPDGFQVHLGSTGCDGDGNGNVTGCAADNVAEIELDGFDPDANRVVLDVAALLAGTDVDADAGGAHGCQSGADDPECGPIFDRLGLPYGGNGPTGNQSFFHVEAR